MARQVLTIPDVPPTLLQSATAAATYVAKGGDTMTGALRLDAGMNFGGDVLLARTGAGALRLDTTLGVGTTAPSNVDPAWPALRVGQSAALTGNTSDQLILASNAYRSTVNWRPVTANVAGAALTLDPNGVVLSTTNAVAALTAPTFTARLTINATGTVGVGVTPEAWDTDHPALRVGAVGALMSDRVGAATTTTYLMNNTYYNTNWLAIKNQPGQLLQLDQGGNFTFYTAPGVTPGTAFNYAQRMALNLNGTLSLTPAAGSASMVTPSGTSGNLHLGGAVGPWRTDLNAIQMRSTAWMTDGASIYFMSNSIWDAVGPKAVSAAIGGAHFNFDQSSGFLFRFAPIAAAGASQTLTTKMNLTNTGTLVLTPDANTVALQIQTGSIAHNVNANQPYTTYNSVYDIMQDGNGHLVWRRGNPPNISVMRMIYSVAGVRFHEDVMPYNDVGSNLGATTNRWATTYTNQVNSQANPLVLSSASSIQLSIGGYGHPLVDNTMYWGHPSYRWAVMYSAGGVVTTSHVSKKEGFSPLDPAACAAAVLDTDWYEFDYKAGDGVEAAVREETAFSRHQRGYVLGSPDHRVSDLFGLADRQSASSGSDLAVVACALQDALKRIAQLEARPA